MQDIEGCPCGSGATLAKCCARVWEEGAQSPEALMRSRYSAYVKQHRDYILATWHPGHLTPAVRAQVQAEEAPVPWLGLHIVAAQADTVEFVAFYRHQQRLAQLHERSSFVFENGRWWYLAGDMLPPITWPVNSPCFCGSGKKFKKCHGGVLAD